MSKAKNNGGVYFYKEIKDHIASKACRYSIMIGENLSKNTMCKVVNNLSKL